MKIKWYGHAAFKVTTDSGIRIIIDPYEPNAFGGALTYGKIDDEADIVLTSHDHDDHNYTKSIKGTFTHIKKAGSYDVKGVKIKAVSTYHDPSKGGERGGNLVFVVAADGMVMAHAGDLGHVLDKEKIAEIGHVDVLLLPVGGFYTIDAAQAAEVAGSLKPAIAIPMHFKTAKCSFPIAEVASFSENKKGVKTPNTSEIEISRDGLPKEPEIIVLEHAL